MKNNKKEFIMLLKFVLFSISAGVIQVLSFTLLNEFVFKISCNRIKLEISSNNETANVQKVYFILQASQAYQDHRYSGFWHHQTTLKYMFQGLEPLPPL